MGLQRYLFIYSIILITLGCDSDKYLLSNLNTHKNMDSTKVVGRVLRNDNYRPIRNASIQVGYLTTYTNNYGSFELSIPLNRDDERNLPSPIIASASKYTEYYGIFYPSHLVQEFDILLTWRPPTSVRASLLISGNIYIVQALVRDFEGAADIDNVACSIYMRDNSENTAKNHIIPMPLQFSTDTITAFYQSNSFSGQLFPGGGKIHYAIIASDKNGYVDTLHYAYLQDFPDQPIYPVEWD